MGMPTTEKRGPGVTARDWRTVMFVLAFAGLATTSMAMRTQAQSPPVGQMDGAWPQVHLSVVVLDKSGDPHATLTPDKFRIFEDHSPRTIESVSTQDSPMSVVFVIDTSGSMYKQGPMIATVVQAVTRELPAGSEMAAIEFSETPHVEQPFAPVAGNDLSVLQHLDARGCTASLDAVLEAEQLLTGEAHFARRALVLIGDGWDNCSTHSIKEAVEGFWQPWAPSFYAFILTPAVKGSPRQDVGENVDILLHAGGAVVFAPRKDQELNVWAGKLAAAIRSQYLLTFIASDAARDGRKHLLEVRVPIKNLAILTTLCYIAPSD